MKLNAQNTFREFRTWSGANYQVEETLAYERQKYQEILKADPSADQDRDQSISLYEYLEFLEKSNPNVKIDFKYKSIAWSIANLKRFDDRDERCEGWRVGAAAHLGEPDYRDPVSLPALYDSLEDPSPRVVKAVILSIGSIGDSSSVVKLIPFLSSANSDLRSVSIEALTEIGSSKGAPNAVLDEIRKSMLLMCKDENRSVALDAIIALEKLGLPDSHLPSLKDLLMNPNQPHRARLILLLQPFKYSAVKEIYAVTLKDSDPALRASALRVIAAQSDIEARKKVIETLQDRDAQIRRQVLVTLQANPQGAEKVVFIEALKDSNPEVRIEALNAMLVLGNREDATLLFQIMSTDPNQSVRAKAREVYDRIKQNMQTEPVFKE